MLSPLDYFVVVVYLLAVLAIGLASHFLPEQQEQEQKQASSGVPVDGRASLDTFGSRNSQDGTGDGGSSSSDGANNSVSRYFLAGRDLSWWAVGLSLFSSNIGSEHFIGLAGTGAASGLAVGHFEINSVLLILVLGWLLVPYYLGSRVYTMPQFLERRYSAACRTWLAVASLLAYVFTKVAVSIFAATVIFRVILELKHEWIGAMILMAATAAYTAVGGLAAVVYTEALQSVVLVVGAGFLFLVGMVQVGGFQGLADKLPEGHFHMFRSAHDHEFPWTGILLGFPVISFWYWCTDQVIVQRVLGAKSIKAAREGTILAGYLKLLPLFLLVFPGMISRALYPDEVQQDSNKAYPLLVVRLLPKGMVGVLVAAMLSALMSSFASLFNSCGTIFTMDFYAKLIRPNASQRELLLSGRAATLVMLFLGMLWIYIIPYLNPQLYIYLQSVQGYFAPPITAVFLVGILWRGANNIGAFACLVLGTMVGGLRLLMEILHGVREKHGNDEEEELHGGDTFTASSWFFKVFVESNFLHFTFGLFVFCVSVLIVGSLVSNWWKRRQRRHLQLFISAAQEEEAEALQQLQQQEDEEERRRAAEIDKLVLRLEDTFLSRFYRKRIPHEGDQETRPGGKKQRRMYAPVLSLKGQGVKDEEDGIEMQSLETKQEEKEDEDCLHEVTLEDEEQEEEEEEEGEESTVTEIATSSPDQLQEQDRRCYVTHAISVALLVSTVFAIEIAFR